MRKIIVTEEFKEFLSKTQEKKNGDKCLEKIFYSIRIVQKEKNPSTKFLKYIKGDDWKGLFEIRASQGQDLFRIFCLFPDENYGEELILLTGFQKKDDKTIRKYKALALKLRGKVLDERKTIEEQEASNLDNKRDAEISDSDNKD